MFYVIFYGADQHVSRILLTFDDVLGYVLSHMCVWCIEAVVSMQLIVSW